MAKTILSIGDVHEPFSLKASKDRIIQIAEEKKPKIIVQIGDLMDLFCASRFPKSLNQMSPKDEIMRAREMAEIFWYKLKKASPNAKCFQLMGNHDERLHKLILSTVPALEHLVSDIGLFEFKGVETQQSERDELIIDDILFMHGFRAKLGDHCVHNRMNTVCGHSHVGGTFFTRLGNKTIWELNSGFCASEGAYSLSYTRQRKISKWTQGCGWIEDNAPTFIPFKNE